MKSFIRTLSLRLARGQTLKVEDHAQAFRCNRCVNDNGNNLSFTIQIGEAREKNELRAGQGFTLKNGEDFKQLVFTNHNDEPITIFYYICTADFVDVNVNFNTENPLPISGNIVLGEISMLPDLNFDGPQPVYPAFLPVQGSAYTEIAGGGGITITDPNNKRAYVIVSNRSADKVLDILDADGKIIAPVFEKSQVRIDGPGEISVVNENVANCPVSIGQCFYE